MLVRATSKLLMWNFFFWGGEGVGKWSLTASAVLTFRKYVFSMNIPANGFHRDCTYQAMWLALTLIYIRGYVACPHSNIHKRLHG